MYKDDFESDYDFDPYENVELSQKEKTIEFLAISLSAGLLLACFMKVLFF